MSVNDAISAAAREREAAEQQTREAVNRAIVGIPPEDDVNALLAALIAAQDGKVVQVNETVIAFDVQQFSERLSAVENRQASQIFGTLATPITRGQLVYWTNTSQLARASAADIGSANRVVGFADQSGVNTQEIRVVRHGVMENPAWNFVPNTVLFLGLDGEPTQNQVGVFAQIVGFVMCPTRVFVNVQKAVIRG